MKQVAEYQVVDHGFDAEQYFRGCGLALSEYDDVATGIGDTAKEAFEDALESLAQNGWETSTIKHTGFSRMSVKGYLKSIGIKHKADGDGSETHAYVSVRVK